MADATIRIDWVAPAHMAGGLDHLGVKAPIMHIYGDLLPGITNVTDRLRYYSFYPWLIWCLEKRQKRTLADLSYYVRRADCLFTLVAEFHRATSDGPTEIHNAAVVGNTTLAAVARRVRDGETVSLSTYATIDSVGTRYFKNRYGGLGQYYLGSLRELLLLGGDTNEGVGFTRERGLAVAEAFESSVDSARFWSCLDEDEVNAADLSALLSFCPCHLARTEREREVLSSVLFARDDLSVTTADSTRRDTLRLLLELAKAIQGTSAELDDRVFRGAVYGASVRPGVPWQVPRDLIAIRRLWSSYVANEILSVGLQGLFFCVLKAREAAQSEEPVFSARDFAEWFLSEGPGVALDSWLGESRMDRLLKQARKELVGIAEWSTPSHELARACAVTDRHHQANSRKALGELSVLSVSTLLALAARLTAGNDPYAGITFPPGYFLHFPLNLRSFQENVAGDWSQMTGRDWVKHLIEEWCVNAHLRVALRKLRSQSNDTFQIRPLDDGLRVVGVPPPQFSSPRFFQARRILADIGALRQSDDKMFVLTALGEDLMGVARD